MLSTGRACCTDEWVCDGADTDNVRLLACMSDGRWRVLLFVKVMRLNNKQLQVTFLLFWPMIPRCDIDVAELWRLFVACVRLIFNCFWAAFWVISWAANFFSFSKQMLRLSAHVYRSVHRHQIPARYRHAVHGSRGTCQPQPFSVAPITAKRYVIHKTGST